MFGTILNCVEAVTCLEQYILHGVLKSALRQRWVFVISFWPEIKIARWMLINLVVVLLRPTDKAARMRRQ